MKVLVKEKPNSKEDRVEPPTPPDVFGGVGQFYTVSVKEPPVRGRANEAIIRVLAEYFGVSKSQIRIISGWSSRQKVIEVDGR